MKKKIAVLGSGATAHAAAATFTLLGRQVTLADLPPYWDNLRAIEDRGGILLRGNGLIGFAKPDCVSADVAAAVRDADVVIVSVVAGRHEEIARAVAGSVSQDQVIVIVPGNAGSLVFDRVFSQNTGNQRALIAEMQGNLFPCRVTGPAEVLAGGGLRKKRVAAFPAKDTPKVISALEGVLETEVARHVFEAALNSPNVIIHLICTALNISKVDDLGKEFSLFIHGLTPSVFRAMEAAWREWEAVMDVLGYWRMESPVAHMRLVAEIGSHPELNVFRSLLGPDSLQHRYIGEDASSGVALLVSLARKAKVETPLTQAVLTLFSIINGIDYYAEGRTLENFGLAGGSLAEIESFLIDGIRPG